MKRELTMAATIATTSHPSNPTWWPHRAIMTPVKTAPVFIFIFIKKKKKKKKKEKKLVTTM